MHSYIASLQRAHDAFAKLIFVGDREENCPGLKPNLENLSDWIFSEACYPNPSLPSAYSNNDEEGRPTSKTTGKMGFLIKLVDNLYASSRGGLEIEVSAGSEGYLINSAQLDYFQPTRCDMLCLELQKQLLSIVVEHWPVEHAVLTSGELMDKTDMPKDQRRTRFMEVGWLTYSRDPKRGQVLAPDVERTHFGPGGVLITAMQHQPSPDSPADLDRLLSIRDTLNANGLLKATWAKR